MNAIAGLFQGDGRTVEEGELRRMLHGMGGRCAGASSTFVGGPVGLAHGAAFSGALGGLAKQAGVAVAADVRLDNREELAAVLSLSSAVRDEEMVLAAYQRWGEDSPSHLLGDFAFALWDAPRRRLFCARDQFGVKPFYYHEAAEGVCFASEMKGLLALPRVPDAVDEARIADFLAFLVEDVASTFYSGIRRLPPAHRLVASSAGVRVSRYWELQAQDPAPRIDAPEELRSLLQSAVASRLRGPGPVGAMLSGGLDSSAIAGLAAPLIRGGGGGRLPTLSLVFDATPDLSERRFIEAVLEHGAYDPSFIAADGYAPFADFGSVLQEQEAPFLAPGLGVSRRLYAAAAERGLRIVLDGHGGDEVVSHGFGRLDELAAAGRWGALWREVRGVAALQGESPWRLYSRYLEDQGPLRAAKPLMRRIERRIRRLRGARAPATPSLRSFINPDLISRTQLAERYRARAGSAPAVGERERHLASLTGPLQAHAFEVFDRASARAGVEARYPFWDRRVVEFCLSRPSEEKLQDGWTRLILRRAMQGILPPTVQWRRGKLDFTPHLVNGMLQHHRAMLCGLFDGRPPELAALVNLPVVSAAFERIKDDPLRARGFDVHMVWRTAVLGLWLEQRRGALPAEAAASRVTVPDV